MVNALTILPMFLTAKMLFEPTDSAGFRALYLLGGSRDPLDGWGRPKDTHRIFEGVQNSIRRWFRNWENSKLVKYRIKKH